MSFCLTKVASYYKYIVGVIQFMEFSFNNLLITILDCWNVELCNLVHHTGTVEPVRIQSSAALSSREGPMLGHWR